MTMNMIFQVYVEGSVEAVDYYCKAFSAEIGRTGMNEDCTYMHAEIKVKDKCIMYISEAKSKQVCENMQFCLTFDGDKEVVKKAYEVLFEDAIKIWNPLGLFDWGSYGFALIDKYGIHWYITGK